MANIPIRVIGADGGGPGQNFNSGQASTNIVMANPQQAEQRLQNAAAQREDAGRIQFESITNAVQQISAEMQAMSNKDSRFAQTLGGLAGVAQVVMDWQTQRREAQEQGRADLEERLSSEQHVLALNEAQTILDNARDTINELGYEQGVMVARRNFNEVLSKYPNLDADTVRQIQTTVFGELRNINGEMWRNQQRDLEEIQDTRRGIAFYNIRAEFGQAIATLGNRGLTAPYEDKLSFFNQLKSQVANSSIMLELPPDEQLYVMEQFLELAGGELASNAEYAAMAQGELERVQQAQRQLQQVQTARDNGLIDYTQYQAMLEQYNVQYQTSLSPTSVTDSIRAHMDETSVWADLQALQQQQLFEEAGPLADLEVGKAVANIMAGRMSRSSLDPNDPYDAQIIEALDTYQNVYLEEYEPLQRENYELGNEMAQLEQQLRLARNYATAFNNASTPEEQARVAQSMGTEAKRAFDNRESISLELAQLQEQARFNTRRLEAIGAQLRPYGLQQGHGRQAEYYNSPEAQEQREQAANIAAEQRARGQQSFNYGRDAQGAAAPRPLPTISGDGGKGYFGLREDALIPFTPDGGGNHMVITSGWHGHPGGRPGHGGVDLAPTAGGTAHVAAVRSGRVVAVGYNEGGWGHFITIEDQNGYRANYGHLASAANFREGDVVSQGQALGVMGSTGRSSGPHLDFAVYPPGVPIAGSTNTVDPIAYLNETVVEAGSIPTGAGIPPSGQASSRGGSTATARGSRPRSNTEFLVSAAPPPPGAFIIPELNGWVYGNTVFFATEEDRARASSRRQAAFDSRTLPAPQAAPGQNNALNPGNVFTSANPQRGPQVSAFKQDYPPNNPDDNFGYRALMEDHQFRHALHNTANNLGIPSQWLADVIAFESGGSFSPSKRNYAGSGATGLIQFIPDTARGLGTSTEALANMTRAEQMQYVERYLRPYADDINTITDLYMSVLYPVAVGQDPDTVIFGAGCNLHSSCGGAYRQNSGLDTNRDGAVTVREASSAIGPHGGRRYEWGGINQTASPIHERHHAGCPTCEGIRRAGGSFFAHQP